MTAFDAAPAFTPDAAPDAAATARRMNIFAPVALAWPNLSAPRTSGLRPFPAPGQPARPDPKES